LLSKKDMSTVLVCDFDMRAQFEQFMPFQNTWIFIVTLPRSSKSIAQFSHAFFYNFLQNLMLIRCSKTDHLFCDKTWKHTRRINATTSTRLALICWSRNCCKLKHAQTCLYYDQLAWLPLICTVKLFRERPSHAMYRDQRPRTCGRSWALLQVIMGKSRTQGKSRINKMTRKRNI
jgi:hypothetical protein